MGEEVAQHEFTREDRTRYREKVRPASTCSSGCCARRFDAEPVTGLEIELNLVDDDEEPALRNIEVLEAIADPDFQTELGQFNLEINVPPRAAARATGSRRSRTGARAASTPPRPAAEVGAHMVMIGILPTLDRST